MQIQKINSYSNYQKSNQVNKQNHAQPAFRAAVVFESPQATSKFNEMFGDIGVIFKNQFSGLIGPEAKKLFEKYPEARLFKKDFDKFMKSKNQLKTGEELAKQPITVITEEMLNGINSNRKLNELKSKLTQASVELTSAQAKVNEAQTNVNNAIKKLNNYKNQTLRSIGIGLWT